MGAVKDWAKTDRRRWILLGVALAAVALLGAWTATDPANLAGDPTLNGFDALGAAVCHRLTEHSFAIGGRQLPLCARCSGIYLGVFLAMIVPWLAGRGRWAAFPGRGALVVLLGMVGLMGVDGLNSYSHFFPAGPHLYEPRNWLRLATGLGAGLALGTLLHAALAQVLWEEAIWRPAIGGGFELGGLVLLSGVAGGLVLSNQPVLLYVMAIGSGVGLLLAVGSINTVLLAIVLHREGRGRTLAGVLPLLGAGLALALVELGGGAALRLALFGTLTGLPGL